MLTKIRVYALFPIWVSAGLAKVALMILTSFALEPLVALTWRTRRYLADATAVQLTRYPDGLARGLLALNRSGGGISGGAWASHLFVIGGSASEAAAEAAARLAAARATARGIGSAMATGQVDAQTQATQAAAMAAASKKGGLSGHRSMVNLHPPLDKRLRRLQALGASVEVGARPRRSLQMQMGPILAWVVFGPLLALCGVLMLVALGGMIGLTFFFMFIYVMILFGIFQLLF